MLTGIILACFTFSVFRITGSYLILCEGSLCEIHFGVELNVVSPVVGFQSKTSVAPGKITLISGSWYFPSGLRGSVASR